MRLTGKRIAILATNGSSSQNSKCRVIASRKTVPLSTSSRRKPEKSGAGRRRIGGGP